MIEISTDKEIKVSKSKDKAIIRFAWGCNNTWFITKQKRLMMPKGARLLMKLICKKTNNPIYTPDKYPTIGSVVGDLDGQRLEIIDIMFL